MIRKLADIYRTLPVKPFRGIFTQLYQKYKLFNKNKIIISTIDGITYELNLNELIDSSIYYNGCFEPMTTKVINKFVKKDMTVLDIGANIGCHTLRFAKLVGQNGKVIAFEPMSWAFSKLKNNIALNKFDNITAEKIVLSSVSQLSQPVCFRTSWRIDGKTVNNNTEYVDTLTLDEYIEEKKITNIDFIKLDVDGYEYKVLFGARKSLQKFRPLILIELGKYTLEGVGDNLENLIDLLILFNYSFYSEENLEKYDNKEALLDSIPSGETINVLCKA